MEQIINVIKWKGCFSFGLVCNSQLLIYLMPAGDTQALQQYLIFTQRKGKVSDAPK